MTERKETIWCTLCGARFTNAEIDGYYVCPKCENPGVPCDTNEDVSVRVNWHELRVLGIWAENYASHCDSKDSTANLARVVHAITRRLQQQFPKWPALTLSGEIAELKSDPSLGASNIETHGVAERKPLPVNGPGAVT